MNKPSVTLLIKTPIHLIVRTLIIIISLALGACQSQAIEKNMTTKSNHLVFTEFEQQIAQRMSLDIRYFCADINGKPSVPTSKHCRQAVTVLPNELAQLIRSTNVGGIVLFAENVQEIAQVVKLNHDIQQAALQSPQAKPLIISMDQEGGRVARFTKMTTFAGNMAIGASYQQHGTHFASQVNGVIAKELKALGINNNYAPVVDVNTNVDNPVINTRSFGESPEQVAELGASAVNAIQAQGVMATLKHFPGHGDTHVDSHLGLPRVDHDRTTIDKVDLAPFAWAIKHSDPAMIMTAHIQYPTLDDSVFVSKNGEKLIRPATMSRKILTNLLREDMAFEGIIATDALDMAGVSHFFSEVEAVVETFIAGADLAVMPFKVRTPADIVAFNDFIKAVAKSLRQRIEQGNYHAEEFKESVARLNKYKEQYVDVSDLSLAQQILTAKSIIANDHHLDTEQALADAAVTVLKDNQRLPLNATTIKHIHLVVANQRELEALNYATANALAKKLSKSELAAVKVSTFVAETNQFDAQAESLLAQSDVVIATVDIKTASLVDLGGMDDLKPSYGSAAQQQQKLSYATLLKQVLIVANKIKTPAILIAKGSPFLINEYSELADTVLLNFDDRVYLDINQQAVSPGFNASMAVIVNEVKEQGQLPVTLKK
ncbi:glycoside hydrolase family 3 protein [Colwellia psychrerythraea]|uniref:beta-N-acetylhexosaminidase n=1 Tax=Colwellia psychrerythraea TaxID=28229 RepID=A0A099KMG9_COLPS|nr:glycoside hydrolase family 3 protein [Colwellia psychrerythraea]KGJ91631.1 Beta-N-acetylhexosaminidase [Colwellia psychrerythraea]